MGHKYLESLNTLLVFIQVTDEQHCPHLVHGHMLEMRQQHGLDTGSESRKHDFEIFAIQALTKSVRVLLKNLRTGGTMML